MTDPGGTNGGFISGCESLFASYLIASSYPHGAFCASLWPDLSRNTGLSLCIYAYFNVQISHSLHTIKSNSMHVTVPPAQPLRRPAS